MAGIYAMIRRLNESPKSIIVSAFVLYASMFVWNVLTIYAGDDFSYMYSFMDGTRIESIFDIIPSMLYHAAGVNGRLVSHAFAQFMLLFPPIVFDVVNTAVYTLLILLLYTYAVNTQKHNFFLFWVIAFAVWYIVPAYGEVFLWLDGACNYLWGVTAILAYIFPFVQLFRDKSNVLQKNIAKVAFVCAGLFVGEWLESASFGAILLAVITVCVSRFLYKKKPPTWTYASITTMCVVYLPLLIEPSSRVHKIAFNGLSEFLQKLIYTLERYSSLGRFALAVFLVLWITAVYMKKDRLCILTSVLFFTISVATNCIHAFGRNYPQRCTVTAAIFLILAIAVLVQEFFHTPQELCVLCMGALLITFSCLQLMKGTMDIASVYQRTMAREEYILTQKANGNLDIEVEQVYPSTKYGIYTYYEEDSSIWPNRDIAKYYGIDSITGKTDTE